MQKKHQRRADLKQLAAKQRPCEVLRGVVALVEVGTESRALPLRGALTSLGATVVPLWSPLVTHVVWSEGGDRVTRAQARASAAHVVSPLWVEACVASNRRRPEKSFPSTTRPSDLPSPNTLLTLLKKAERDNVTLTDPIPEKDKKKKMGKPVSTVTSRDVGSDDSQDEFVDKSRDKSADSAASTSRGTTTATLGKKSQNKTSTGVSDSTSIDVETRVNTNPRRALPLSSSPAVCPKSGKARRKLFTQREVEPGSTDSDSDAEPMRATPARDLLRFTCQTQRKRDGMTRAQTTRPTQRDRDGIARAQTTRPTQRDRDGIARAQTTRPTQRDRDGLTQRDRVGLARAERFARHMVHPTSRAGTRTSRAMLPPRPACRHHKTTRGAAPPRLLPNRPPAYCPRVRHAIPSQNTVFTRDGKFRIVMTGMSRVERRRVYDEVKQLDAKVQKDVNFKTTHVVVGHYGMEPADNTTGVPTASTSRSRAAGAGEGGALRTLSALLGAARGCRIVHAQWVLDSARAGQWLSHRNYVVQHLNVIAEKAFLERHAFDLMNAEYAYDVFKRRRVRLSRDANNRRAVERLLALCGAVVLDHHGQVIHNAALESGQPETPSTRDDDLPMTNHVNWLKEKKLEEVVIGVGYGQVSSRWVFDSVEAARMRDTRGYTKTAAARPPSLRPTEPASLPPAPPSLPPAPPSLPPAPPSLPPAPPLYAGLKVDIVTSDVFREPN